MALFFSIILSIAFHTSDALEWVRFHVPDFTNVHQPAILTCQFDLKGDLLYAVKWYKDDREIYRYVPTHTPPQEAFKMDGIRIDVKKSDSQHLVLRSVDFESGGCFKCEVLMEGPVFRTLIKSGELKVVDLPKGGPILYGQRDEYRMGELVNVTCSTAPSVPAANITWFINGRKAKPDELSPYYHQRLSFNTSTSQHLTTTSSVLFTATNAYFTSGYLELNCRANIFSVYDSKVVHTAIQSPASRLSMFEGFSYGTRPHASPTRFIPLLILTLAL